MVKTHSYYGQPRFAAFGMGNCDHTGELPGNIAEFEEWLLQPKPLPKPLLSGEKPLEQKMTYNPTIKPPEKTCVCRDKGADGTTICSPTPHKHNLLFSKTSGPMTATRACNNHLQQYLDTGWFIIAGQLASKTLRESTKDLACTRCVTNAAMIGDTVCEVCAQELDAMSGLNGPKNDALRLGEVGYCINRGVVQGCAYYSEPNANMCKFCQNYIRLSREGHAMPPSSLPAHNPRIRTVPTSARPCAITKACPGTMTASVRRFVATQPPELWWSCPLCRAQKLAERTMAILDKNNVSPRMRDALEVLTGDSETAEGVLDLTGFAEGVRDMLADSD